ncbi:antibiotic biosynthesis monooxygenase family protein [uncultured Methylobacterium sp.]|uniref:antibiotic biosynthesis monooxygenase family protein n=1 Tax=uncultured Methylobacterium sp. TaxID=157278 RepID=UPI0035CB0646
MTKLDPSAGYLTLINTFDVEPDRAAELLAVLSKATEETIRSVPGFISANLHVSRDGRHIANYAQWRSQADMDAMLADPAAQVHMREAAGIATSFNPIVYDLREVHEA